MAKQLLTDPEQIRLQEDSEVQSILGRPPSWLTRWGITLTFFGMLGLLVLGSILRYPDVIEAPAMLLSEDPPIRLEAKVDGRIEQWWINNGQLVDSGQRLLALQSPVALEDVQTVQAGLAALLPALKEKQIDHFRLPQDLQLAELQADFSQLSRLLDTHQYRLSKSDVQRRLSLYRQQIEARTDLRRVTDAVIDTLRAEVSIAKNNQDKYRQLLQSGAASELEFEQAQTEYLRYRRELENKESEHINNRLEIQQIQDQLISLSQEESDELKAGWVQLTEAARLMRARLDAWEDTYIIQAPRAGRVILSDIWSKHQFVDRGEVVLTINPDRRNKHILVRAELPAANSGKVDTGQTVLLRLTAYPYQEFGVLEGKVSYIAPLPLSGDPPTYSLLIDMVSDSLLTTSQRRIPFTQEMRATARIITDDRSFLGRVMEKLIKPFSRS